MELFLTLNDQICIGFALQAVVPVSVCQCEVEIEAFKDAFICAVFAT